MIQQVQRRVAYISPAPQTTTFGSYVYSSLTPVLYSSPTQVTGGGAYVSLTTIIDSSTTITTLTTITTSTSTNTDATATATSTIPVVNGGSGARIGQGAIIAISIICGLLLLALLLALVVILARRHQSENLMVGIQAGGQHRHKRRHTSRRTETEYSGNGTDDYRGPIPPNIGGLAGMRRTGDPYRDRYGQFPGPIFIPPGNGNGQPVQGIPQGYFPHGPEVKVPVRPREEESVADDPSDASTSRAGGRRGTSHAGTERRRPSKSSSSRARGR